MPTTTEPEKLWNSLEVCKLIVGLMVPIAIVVVSNQYSNRERLQTEQHETRQKADDMNKTKQDEREKREVDKRFNAWEQMAPQMNQIYSYFLYIGDWKTTSPEQIVEKKRQLDDLIYSNRIFFTDQFFNSYSAFMRAAFTTSRGWEKDPQLNTVPIRKLDRPSKVEFNSCDNADAVYKAYWDFQDASSVELNLPKVPASPRPSQRPTGSMAEPCASVL
jgi:hypothetical protein